MVPSTTRKIFSLAISLLVVVISLTGVALGATVPTVAKLSRYTPGFAGDPGKMARDAAGNFYIADFWGKGIVKLNAQGSKTGFIPTDGRPSSVAVLKDGRLVVAIAKPVAKVAFYSQVTGDETLIVTPAPALFNPADIALDANENIYVVDSGDTGSTANPSPTTINVGKVRVYSSSGIHLLAFGTRTLINTPSETAANGSFKMPMGIAYEKVSGNIAVADTMNQRLQFFKNYAADPNCAFVATLGTPAGVYVTPIDNNTTIVAFGGPTGIAFEYDAAGTVLNRIYATERGNGSVVVIDPVSKFSLARINAASATNPEMKFPSGIVFEKTTTGGVLYVSNAAATNDANIIVLGVDSGTVPAQTVTMTMNSVPATSSTPSITVSGTTVAATSVVCSVNGGSDVAATGTGTWSASLPLVDNLNNYILCKTLSGGAYKEAYTFKGTATAAPVVTITEPSATVSTTASMVTVTGTSNLANTTVQLVNSLNSFTTTVQTDVNNKWSAVVNLSEGSNSISATGWRSGTATSSPVGVTVNSDTIAPVLNISFLNDTATTNTAIQNVDGFITDANLKSIEVNGVPVPTGSQVAISAGLTYFSLPVTIVRGLNTINVVATDFAGNVSLPNSRTVTLNPEIPGLSVALPADNSFMKGVSTASASGAVATSFATITLPDNSSVGPVSGVWSAPSFAVNASLSPYMFKASGAVTPDVTVKRTILNSALYSQLAITNPPADVSVKTSSIVIEGVVAANFSPAPMISIDGAAAVAVTPSGDYATTGKFSYSIPSMTVGLHVIKVTADATTAIRNIILDTTPPDLTVQADSKTMPTTIHGSIEPSSKISAITASLSGSPVIIPISEIIFDTYSGSGSVSWHAVLDNYTYDAISFSSLDPADNLATISYKKGIPTGDVDGDGKVRLADALATLRHLAGTELIDAESTSFFNGDVGALIGGRVARDGVIDITDSVLILNKAYGLMTF